MSLKNLSAIKCCAIGSVLLAALCSCTKSQTEMPVKPDTASSRIEITVKPPVVKLVKLEDVNAEKLNAPASNHETARTDWVFTISPELDFKIVDEKDDKKDKENGYHVWVEITSVRLGLALPITSYISDRAPKYVFAHEDGHVKICRRIYANARALANEAASKVFDKRFEGIGRDQKMALSNALQFAGQEMAAFYRNKTGGEAEKVSSKYDQLCLAEDRKDKVDKTIDDAFAAVNAENPPLQK